MAYLTSLNSAKTYVAKLTILQIIFKIDVIVNTVNIQYLNITSYRIKHNDRFNLLMGPKNVYWVSMNPLSRKSPDPML